MNHDGTEPIGPDAYATYGQSGTDASTLTVDDSYAATGTGFPVVRASGCQQATIRGGPGSGQRAHEARSRSVEIVR